MITRITINTIGYGYLECHIGEVDDYVTTNFKV